MDEASENAALAALDLAPTVKVATGLVALTGVVSIMSALQLWGSVRFSSATAFIPYAMVLLGLAALALTPKLYRQRDWAALAGTGLLGTMAAAAIAWFLFALLAGMFSLYAIFLPLLATGAAVLCVLSIGPCRRASLARRTLASAGLATDF